jgi:hypothetical protein
MTSSFVFRPEATTHYQRDMRREVPPAMAYVQDGCGPEKTDPDYARYL